MREIDEENCVVDDQPVLSNIYRSKFAAEGFHVEVAADGEAALEVIRRAKPDLVLLDLMLPKIKGGRAQDPASKSLLQSFAYSGLLEFSATEPNGRSLGSGSIDGTFEEQYQSQTTG